MTKPREPERQPLLSGQANTDSVQHEHEQHQQQDAEVRQTYKAENWFLKILAPIEVIDKKFRFLPLIACTIILLNEGEWFFKQTPYFRAVEAMYCIEYYNEVDPDIAKLGRAIPENLCKMDSIEEKVAYMTQMVLFTRMACSLFSTIPLGWIGDRKGRKIVLVLHKFGTITFVLVQIAVYLLYPKLPIWVLYFAGAGALIGANFDLNLAMLFASYTDVIPSLRSRTTMFFVTTAMQYVGQAIFPPLAAVTMNSDGRDGTPEISLYCSVGLAVVGLLVTVLLVPETLGAGQITNSQKQGLAESDEAEIVPIAEAKSENGLVAKVRGSIRTSWENFKEGIATVGLFNLSLFALSALCTSIALKSIDWLGLIQFPVVRLGWKYSQTNIILTTQAIVYMANYFILLPGYNRLGNYLKLSALNTSLYIMLLSSGLLITGSFCLGFTWTDATFMSAMVVYTLGTGLPVVTQTYIANSVGKDRLGRILAVFSMVSVLGKLASSGLGPVIFSAGIHAGKELMKGLIFWYGSVLFTISMLAVSTVALRTRWAATSQTPSSREP